MAKETYMNTVRRLLILTVSAPIIVCASSWDQVASQQDRCEIRLEQVGYRLKRLEHGIERLNAALHRLEDRQRESTAKIVAELEQNRQRLQNRVDRALRLADKNSRDIRTKRTASGGCPDCIQSSVTLFCRQVDDLAATLDETHMKIAQTGQDIGIKLSPVEEDAPADSLERLFARAQALLDSSPDTRAASLIEKAAHHRNRANALQKQNETDQSSAERLIAIRFLEKAISLMSATQ